MNIFEFKQQLLKDSFTTDEEFHRMRKEDASCAKAYSEAMAFERILKKSLDIPVPSNLKDSIIFKQSTEKDKTSFFKKYALAASFFLSVLVASGVWYTNQPGPLEAFVKQAMKMEPIEYISKDQLPKKEVEDLFASLNTKLVGDIGDVHFMKMCKTPGGMGARMVLMTQSGPVTILYMPKADLDNQVDFELNNFKGALVAMENGAAAIIGDQNQSLTAVTESLQTNLKAIN